MDKGLIVRVGAAAFVCAALAGPGVAQQASAPAEGPQIVSLKTANDPYRPYAFLIGDWISKEGSSTLRQSFRWGPQRAYILYSTYMRQPGSNERLHFEGIMVWNGKTHALDFLFAVEPGSLSQEKGTLNADADGTIVRDVELTAPNGSVSAFRQTIRRIGQDTAVTSLMRRTDKGWEPNFPGSDRITMTRKLD